jgi:hypothetical protein
MITLGSLLVNYGGKNSKKIPSDCFQDFLRCLETIAIKELMLKTLCIFFPDQPLCHLLSLKSTLTFGGL